MSKVAITPSGYANLSEELTHLKTNERPSVIKAIAEAREHGDLKENAEYHAARDRQSFIEGRIIELEDLIARAEVININKLAGNTVKFGATVKLVDDETEAELVYQIVSEYESDIDNGKISLSSPLAKSMIGKAVGDQFELVTPSGTKDFEILDVKYV